MVNLVKTNIKKPYVQKNLIVNKRNIKQFVRPEWHREFREAHIKTIRSSILKGEHPSENITVNETGSKKRILNGNHRIEAIRNILVDYPKFSIELTVTIYYGLTKEEEIVIYEKVNNVRRETGLDKLKAHLTGTEIYNLITQNFPFRVLYRSLGKTDRNAMTANAVFLSYMNRDNKSIAGGSQYILKRAGELDERDYNRMVKFARFFKRIFGEPSKENIYSSFNVYGVVGKMYYNWVGTDLTEAEFEKLMKKVISRYTSDLMMFKQGLHKQKMLYQFIYDKIKGRRKLFNAFADN